MSRVGRSLPAGPATTPQASSGWSRRAWATIASTIALSMVSTRSHYRAVSRARGWQCPQRPLLDLRQRVEQRLLQVAQVGVDAELEDPAGSRIVQYRVVQLLAEIRVGRDAEPGAHRQAGVVDGAQPGLGGLAVEAYLPLALVRQGREDRTGLIDLPGLEGTLGVEAELGRVAGPLRIDVGEQPGDHRVGVVHAVGQQTDHLTGDLAQDAHLVEGEARHAVAALASEHLLSPRSSGPVHRRPETVSMQLVGVHLHALAGTGGDHRLALDVDVHHELLGLFPAVAEELLEDPGHVRHEVDRIVPDDGHPRPVIGRCFVDLRRLGGSDLWQRHAPMLPPDMPHW